MAIRPARATFSRRRNPFAASDTARMDAAVESGAVGPRATADEFRRVSGGGMKKRRAP
jgi:hypothetical protein